MCGPAIPSIDQLLVLLAVAEAELAPVMTAILRMDGSSLNRCDEKLAPPVRTVYNVASVMHYGSSGTWSRLPM